MDIDIDYLKFYNLFINRLYPENKNILLEPLSSIFRLLLLKYKPVGTKISICNNSIKYNSPGYSQGIMRNINGDAREDLHNLYNPLSNVWSGFQLKKMKRKKQKCINIIILNPLKV